MHPGAHNPAAVAVIMESSGHTVTFGELDRRSAQLARVLRDAGLATGDGVALLSENTPWFHEVYWAALRSGLYLTPINRHLTAEEVAYILGDCGAKAIVVSESLADVGAAALARVPDCRHRMLVGTDHPGFERYELAIAAQDDGPLTDQPRGALMCYSSGTTGRPKGIRRPLAGKQIDDPTLANSIDLFVKVYGMGPTTRYLSPGPLYHAAPLAWTGAVQTVGGTTIIMERFDPQRALHALTEHSVTHSQWVPTMFVRMLKSTAPDEREALKFPEHRFAIHAAAPCPPDVKREMLSWWGPIVWEYYAATESNGATLISGEEWLRRPGSVGKPLFGELHICDDDGNELPVGQSGLIYFGSSAPFVYHGDNERTQSTRHPHNPNWSTVGDVGYVDADGYLYLTDRKAFMIISGGVNIYPREIEDCLVTHPAVADIAVFGIPHEEMGESVHASIELIEGVTPSESLREELTEYARDRIAGFKIPRSIDFVDNLPRMATGKLNKQPLKEKFWR